MGVLKIRILKNYLKMRVLKIKFKNWNFEKIIWKWKFWQLNLRIGILKMEVLKIKFENWNFEKLFENGVFKN